MAVIGRASDNPGIAKVDKWMAFLSLRLTDQIELTANTFSSAFQVTKPFFLYPRITNAQTSGLVKYRRFARLLR